LYFSRSKWWKNNFFIISVSFGVINNIKFQHFPLILLINHEKKKIFLTYHPPILTKKKHFLPLLISRGYYAKKWAIDPTNFFLLNHEKIIFSYIKCFEVVPNQDYLSLIEQIFLVLLRVTSNQSLCNIFLANFFMINHKKKEFFLRSKSLGNKAKSSFSHFSNIFFFQRSRVYFQLLIFC